MPNNIGKDGRNRRSNNEVVSRAVQLDDAVESEVVFLNNFVTRTENKIFLKRM